MKGLVEIFFPPACVACARVLPQEASFCEKCDSELERIPDQRCRLCAEPGEHEDETCPRCVLHPPPFVRAWAPFAHAGPIARAIHQLKYEDHPELARPLGALLCEEAVRFLRTAPRAVSAIPLHRTRVRERKFDQAELLAGELCRAWGAEHLDVLTRVRATERQVGQSEAARTSNMSGAFTASTGAAGRDVLLVDDVFTTGATARAATEALLGTGASSVQVLTLARAFSL